jgi:radical SAM superfamily enzyme YgiQ (UPF0313 family)
MIILLISTTRETLPDPAFPIGLAYVGAALLDAGHDVQTLDLCFLPDSEIETRIAEAIRRLEPEVVGLSLRNIDNVSYPETTCYVELYHRVVRACRGATTATLVVGGAGFTIMPAEFMAALDVDYGVVGEGEHAMVELLDMLSRDSKGPLPAGVVTPDQTQTSPRRIEDWGLRRPAQGLFNAAEYYAKGGMLNLQTRRGCPHRCVYCAYPRIEGSRVRLRPVAQAVDEVETLLNETMVRHLFLVDSVFNHPRDYALAFCDELIRRKLAVAWTCYVNPGEMDSELIERMVAAGCEGVEFGTDGLVDEVLESLGKSFTHDKVAETSELCRKLKLRFCHFIFLGSPDEDLDRARLSLERLEALDAYSAVVMAGIRIHPGTALAERARTELGLERPGLEPVFYVSPQLIDHLGTLLEGIAADHPSWVIPGTHTNYDERVQRVMRRRGKRGVIWHFLSRL